MILGRNRVFKRPPGYEVERLEMAAKKGASVASCHPDLTVGGIRDRRFQFFTYATASGQVRVLKRATFAKDGCEYGGDRIYLFVGGLYVAASSARRNTPTLNAQSRV